MAENENVNETVSENKPSNSSNTVIILLLVIIVLLVAGGAVAAGFLMKDTEEAQAETTGRVTLPYEAGAVIENQEAMDEQVSAMAEQIEEGMMNLKFKRVAISEDGENFSCEIGNSERNRYDMYIDIYKDTDLEDQLYVSGLIPPGASIYEFTTSERLPSGDYEAVLVLTQIEDDHATIHAQTMVYLTLMVD